MLEQYVGEYMISIINFNKGIRESLYSWVSKFQDRSYRIDKPIFVKLSNFT